MLKVLIRDLWLDLRQCRQKDLILLKVLLQLNLRCRQKVLTLPKVLLHDLCLNLRQCGQMRQCRQKVCILSKVLLHDLRQCRQKCLTLTKVLLHDLWFTLGQCIQKVLIVSWILLLGLCLSAYRKSLSCRGFCFLACGLVVTDSPYLVMDSTSSLVS